MTATLEFFTSPVGPAALLLIGALLQLIIGRRVRQPDWLTGLALFFVLIAAWVQFDLRERPIVPIFSQPWQPMLQAGTNLYWVGDGWNWFIASLILLLGGLGILLNLNGDQENGEKRVHGGLAVNLAVLAAALLFVGSGNLLTAILTWVVLDIFILVRYTTQPELTRENISQEENHTRGLSLVGAMLLLIALLPAGPTGPSQEFQTGTLPTDVVILIALAAAIRAGIYPFHLWLTPYRRAQVTISERLLEHLVPVLCGLWLLGWALRLGDKNLWAQFQVIALLLLAFLGSALSAWTAKSKADHTTLVLITSASLAAINGVLAYNIGPSAMIWATTAFALGGALWLIGEQVWLGWGWQVPVSVGAATLIGIPFTPGFLTQPATARLLTSGSIFTLLFGLYILAQMLQIAALLRSWEEVERQVILFQPGEMIRLLVACIAIGLPLAVAGFLPRTVAAMASLPESIPPTLGNPPSVVAPLAVWITLVTPLLLGIITVMLRPQSWSLLRNWPDRIHGLVCLDWLFQLGWWGMGRVSDGWGSAVRVVEGAGYVGWLIVFVLMGYLLM